MLGIQNAPDPRTRAQRVQWLAALDAEFDWLMFDVECTRSYGVVAGRAIPSGGVRVGSKDALIAAQAHRYGASLMTANVDDFGRFAHLVPLLQPTPRSLAARSGSPG